MTASKLSELMSAYGPVQYAEAAPEVAKDEGGGAPSRRLHCYGAAARAARPRLRARARMHGGVQLPPPAWCARGR